MMQSKIWLPFLLVICISCKKDGEIKSRKPESHHQIRPEYAKGFSIDEYGDYKTVSVYSPYLGSKDTITWYLISKGSDENIVKKLVGEKVVRTPIESIVCTSTTHIPLLDYLDVEDALIGFPNLDYISTPSIRQRIEEGKVTDMGVQINMNLELLVSINPDLVMGYTMTGDFSQFDKIEGAGIPVILNSEYLEPHPLGRAEWIKFLAVFFDKSAMADSIFNNIRDKYFQISNQVDEVKFHPSVLSGVVYGDTWFIPGGDNYASKIIQDAGGDYLWSDDSSSGYLELSFESVYNKGLNADYWIGVASYNTLNQLAEADIRYTNFKPYREGNVYSYNKRIGPKGGNEYLELGYLRPDLILKDLAMIFHPEQVQKQELYFYEQLK